MLKHWRKLKLKSRDVQKRTLIKYTDNEIAASYKTDQETFGMKYDILSVSWWWDILIKTYISFEIQWYVLPKGIVLSHS